MQEKIGQVLAGDAYAQMNKELGEIEAEAEADVDPLLMCLEDNPISRPIRETADDEEWQAMMEEAEATLPQEGNKDKAQSSGRKRKRRNIKSKAATDDDNRARKEKIDKENCNIALNQAPKQQATPLVLFRILLMIYVS